MQLIPEKEGRKSTAGIGAILSSATCSLLMAIPLAQADSGGEQPWRVDVGAMHYAENERITVNEKTVRLKYQINEDNSVSIRSGYDSVSGSSPSGAVKIQSRSSASGASYLAKFQTERTSFGADWDTSLGESTRLTLTADRSMQSTYESTGVGATLAWDFNQRNTTLVGGVGYSQDLVKPKGGIHYELTPTPTAGVWKSDDTKEQLDLQLGITQVLTRETLFQLNYVRSRAAGYMTNPYKIISVVNSVTGRTDDYDAVTENRPRTRDTNALYTQLNRAVGNAVAYFSYRYFWDDWGIKAHTVDVKYRQPLGERFYFQPHVRYYQQSAADFYRSMLTNTEGLPVYASADYRLAKLHTTTLGGKFGYHPSFGGELSARLEFLRQQGENQPWDAVGVQREAGVFPTLRARMVSIDYTVLF